MDIFFKTNNIIIFTITLYKWPKTYCITNIKSVNFAKDGSYPIIVKGNMQVHGVNKAMETKGVIVVTKGLPKATAKFTVTLKDFGIGGVLIDMVADQVDVEVVAIYQ